MCLVFLVGGVFRGVVYRDVVGIPPHLPPPSKIEVWGEGDGVTSTLRKEEWLQGCAAAAGPWEGQDCLDRASATEFAEPFT